MTAAMKEALIKDGLLDEYYEHDELADDLEINPRTLDRWNRLGEGPPCTLVGRRRIYHRRSAAQWLRYREKKGRVQ